MARELHTTWQQARQTVQARWTALGQREQRGLLLAAFAVGVALVWSVALAPALRSLNASAEQDIQLAAAAERMQSLQTRAKRLQATPTVGPQDSLRALQAATASLGKGANLQVVGEQATITLTQVSAQNLAAWLTSDAVANLSPTQAHLQRDVNSTEPRWTGSLLFRLPAANGRP